MERFSTREAAKKLGIDHSTLANYVAVGKLRVPETVRVGRRVIHLWTEADLEHVRKLLPKIKNGRKTRYQKQKGKSQTKKQTKPKNK